jgi:hypothetical protein
VTSPPCGMGARQCAEMLIAWARPIARRAPGTVVTRRRDTLGYRSAQGGVSPRTDLQQQLDLSRRFGSARNVELIVVKGSEEGHHALGIAVARTAVIDSAHRLRCLVQDVQTAK